MTNGLLFRMLNIPPLPEIEGWDSDLCPWCKWEQDRLLDGPGPHDCEQCGKAFEYDLHNDDGPIVRGVRSDTDLRYMKAMGLEEPK